GLDETLRVAEMLNPVETPGSMILLSDLFTTENRFYGGQVGALAQFRPGPRTLDLPGKIALGDTHPIVNLPGAPLTSEPGFPTRLEPGGLLALPTNIGRRDRDRFTVVPEVGINVGYNITENLRVFAGYNFLYWSSVVRPENAIDRAVNTTQLPP